MTAAPARNGSMIIGVLQFELRIPGAESLKDKRRVVRSLKDRLHREHMVSIAETGTQDVINLATIALACVGTGEGPVAQTLDRILNKVRSGVDAELIDSSRAFFRPTDEDLRPADAPDPEHHDAGLDSEFLRLGEEALWQQLGGAGGDQA